MRAFYLRWEIGTTGARTRTTEIAQTPSARLTGSAPTTRMFPLPWSHYVRLLSIANPHARHFYEREAIRGAWSVRQLDRQIGSQFYERTALSRNKAALLSKGQVRQQGDTLTAEEEIRDPLVLEFLNLKDEYGESDLEEALVRHLEAFLLELGDDFCFVGRQRKLRIDDKWFKIDLVFFHRRLRCILLVDLKIGAFGHADAGQMNLYLNYAKEHWVREGENPPVGLIHCARRGTTRPGMRSKGWATRYSPRPTERRCLTNRYLLPNWSEHAVRWNCVQRLVRESRPPGERRHTGQES